MTVSRRIVIGSGVVLSSLGVAACSTTMEIAVTGSLESPAVAFSDFGGGPKRVCLGSLTIYESNAPAPRTPVWEIGDVETECVTVGSVTYGRGPGGLSVRAGPVPLKADTEYRISASGSTGRLTNVTWYGGGPGARVIFRDGAWRPASG